MKRIKSYIKLIPAAITLSLLLSGCGAEKADTATDAADAAGEVEPGQEADSGQDNAGSETSGKASPADKMTGEWVYVCNIYHYESYDEEEYSYDTCNMAIDDYAPESGIIISRDGDKFLADYRYEGFETSVRIYGNELKYREYAAYRDSTQRDWCMEFTDPFMDMGESPYRVSLADNDTLIVSREYESDKADEYQYYSVDSNVYMRKGDSRLDDPENLRYFDTVEVSSAKELLDSIQSNRKIILKEGVYNFSEMGTNKIDNPRITSNWGEYTITGVNNLRIEAEEGADVELAINEAYDPVLCFENCEHIFLKGFTAGHHVEPGYCSGSVIHLDSMSYVDIEDCQLYGCGTYGIEAQYVSYLNVINTEIYECTYGLLDLHNVSTALFRDCVMRDSCDLDLINVSSAYDVVFENCKFSDNYTDYEDCYFVSQDEYSRLTFTDCTFTNNRYPVFSNRELTMDNCEADGNKAAFSDMLTPEVIESKEDAIRLYDAADQKQKEIDNRIAGNSLLDQLTLNQLAYEEYEIWDTLINQLWAYLQTNLSEEEMETLRAEQKQWIKEKETSSSEAGSDFEGGSMQPMIEYGTAARATKKRVDSLMQRYINGGE